MFPARAAAMMCWNLLGREYDVALEMIERSSATGLLQLTVMWSPLRSATRRPAPESASFIPGVDLER